MTRRRGGFSIIELMIAIVVLTVVSATASDFFLKLLSMFKQQGKIAETNIEGVIGLELLRHDLTDAGYGLPWNGLPAYSDSAADPNGLNDASGAPPRGILSGNDLGFGGAFVGSDHLVIKSAAVSDHAAAGKWTTLGVGDAKRNWGDTTVDLAAANRVIVLAPGSTPANSRTLVVDGVNTFTQFGNTTNFAPTALGQTNIVYGITDAVNLRMPFNRADYYISSANVPEKCAPGTGVLVKAVVNHAGGGFSPILPLLDCVADVQVVFRGDFDGDGEFDDPSDDISAKTAVEIRDQVREARVYVLAQEGEYDPAYTHSPATIYVGDPGVGSGRNYTLDATTTPSMRKFRWKLRTVAVGVDNLR